MGILNKHINNQWFSEEMDAYKGITFYEMDNDTLVIQLNSDIYGTIPIDIPEGCEKVLVKYIGIPPKYVSEPRFELVNPIKGKGIYLEIPKKITNWGINLKDDQKLEDFNGWTFSSDSDEFLIAKNNGRNYEVFIDSGVEINRLKLFLDNNSIKGSVRFDVVVKRKFEWLCKKVLHNHMKNIEISIS